MALTTLPELLNEDKYPSDAKERASRLLNDCKGGSVGSYTDSTGLSIVKKDIAKYLEERDNGVPSNPDNIFLTTGASDGIKMIIELLLTDKDSKPAGFMIPIPQYPLYSATISEYSAEQVIITPFKLFISNWVIIFKDWLLLGRRQQLGVKCE